MSVNKHILSHASITQPVIVVIDEIDIIMHKALQEKTTIGETRLCHTESKQTLNNMLDVIDSTRFVIAIYTTEKSIDELSQTYDPSFIRKGRIDYYINMTNDSIEISNAI